MKKRVPIKSTRGVYYDLSKSPYEYMSPYGDLFKFSSQKKLDIYTREIEKEMKRVSTIMERNKLQNYLPHDTITMLYRIVYHALYDNMVK